MYTILVVDDEKDIVSALEIYLKAEGLSLIHIFLQQSLLFPEIADAALHPDGKILPPLALQILQRQAVALVAVLLREYQQLVFISCV